MRKYSIELDTKQIDALIGDLEKYRDSLDDKLQTFVQELAKIGLDAIDSTIFSIPPEEKGNDLNTEGSDVTLADGTASMYIKLKGSKVLFIEFSAGVTYGTKDYPLESGAGYGVGTYPGQTHAYDEDGWWYTGEDGKGKHSYGNRAYMPMYHSTEAMSLVITDIAQRVFGS